MRLLLITLLCAIVFKGVIVEATAAQFTLDTAVNRVIERFNSQPNGLTFYREVGRISDDNGAVIFVEVVNRETGQAYPGVIDWLYAYRVGEQWLVASPGDGNYRDAYRELSEVVTDQIEDADRLYRTQALAGRVSPQELARYELPFPNGTFGTITRSFIIHGTGKIDFDLTGRDISAAKDGIIVYASDGNNLQTFQQGGWWYWNTVIIRHADYEYSLYGHVAQNSIPDWIKRGCVTNDHFPNCYVPVHTGDVIALEGNTGNSTNPHLHIEFGQGAGVVPYLDVLDGDGDDVLDEVIYAGYVYGEQNVGLDGYTPDQVAEWQYLTVLESEIEGR